MPLNPVYRLDVLTFFCKRKLEEECRLISRGFNTTIEGAMERGGTLHRRLVIESLSLNYRKRVLPVIRGMHDKNVMAKWYASASQACRDLAGSLDGQLLFTDLPAEEVVDFHMLVRTTASGFWTWSTAKKTVKLRFYNTLTRESASALIQLLSGNKVAFSVLEIRGSLSVNPTVAGVLAATRCRGLYIVDQFNCLEKHLHERRRVDRILSNQMALLFGRVRYAKMEVMGSAADEEGWFEKALQFVFEGDGAKLTDDLQLDFGPFLRQPKALFIDRLVEVALHYCRCRRQTVNETMHFQYLNTEAARLSSATRSFSIVFEDEGPDYLPRPAGVDHWPASCPKADALNAVEVATLGTDYFYHLHNAVTQEQFEVCLTENNEKRIESVKVEFLT